MRGGEYHDFPSNFFCLTVAKLFLVDPLMFHFFRLPEKNHASRGYVDFLSKIVCLAVLKHTAVVNSLVFDQFRGWKMFLLDLMGEYENFPSKNFVSQCRKDFGCGNPLLFH